MPSPAESRLSRGGHASSPLRFLLGSLLFLAMTLPFGFRFREVTPIAAAATEASSDDDEETVDMHSPRAALTDFFALTRHGKYLEAARYLDFRSPPPSAEEQKRKVAHLDAVLRRYAVIDLNTLSPRADGTQTDKGQVSVSRVGIVPIPKSAVWNIVRLKQRLETDGHTYWKFSDKTVDRIEEWYAALPDRWVREHLPGPFRRIGPQGLLWWQWMAFPLLVLFGMGVGWALWRLSCLVASLLGWNNTHRMLRFSRPFCLLVCSAFCVLESTLLVLDKEAEHFVSLLFRANAVIACFWVLLCIVDNILESAAKSSWGKQHPSGISMFPLLRKVMKSVVVTLGMISLLFLFGYPVSSLLAGFGLGAAALAFGAQKTMENLFGSLSIGLDQPFRVGDDVLIDGTQGTVEAFGFRSTRIRTLDRTLVTFPNAKIADLRVENLSTRDRFRLHALLHLPTMVSPTQLQEVAQELEEFLIQHPFRCTDNPAFALFQSIARDALILELCAWFRASNIGEFRVLRQTLLLEILHILARHHVPLTPPAFSVHMDPPPTALPSYV